MRKWYFLAVPLLAAPLLYFGCMNKPKQVVEEKPVNVPLYPRVKLTGTTWQGGKYFGHKRDKDTLLVEIKAPNNTIYEAHCTRKTEFSLSNHNTHEFRYVSFDEACDWLEKNKSDKLITCCGVWKGAIDGFNFLIPADSYDTGIRFEWHKE